MINLDTWLQLPTAGQPVEVAGHAGRLGSATNAGTGDTWRQLDVLLGGWHVTVSTGGPGGLPTAELAKIAAGLRLADPTDLSTWFDARTALP